MYEVRSILAVTVAFIPPHSPSSASSFCLRAATSLSAFVNHGALPCACHEVGAESDACEPFGGQCRCKPNVIGRDCSMCTTGYWGFPDCRREYPDKSFNTSILDTFEWVVPQFFKEFFNCKKELDFFSVQQNNKTKCSCYITIYDQRKWNLKQNLKYLRRKKLQWAVTKQGDYHVVEWSHGNCKLLLKLLSLDNLNWLLILHKDCLIGCCCFG